MSEGVNELIQIFAQRRLREVGLQKGRVCDKGDCLITRMGSVGEGGEAAGKRRKSVIRWERRSDLCINWVAF